MIDNTRQPASRRLEQEAQRNVELTGRLAPDFKTIADFRKDNGPAIRDTCPTGPVQSRRRGDRWQQVQGGERARQELHQGQAEEADGQLEASIEGYIAALETADRQEGELAQAKAVRLQEKIAALREQMAAFKALEPVVHAAPGQQVSLTDPDARSMATSGRGSGVVVVIGRDRGDAHMFRFILSLGVVDTLSDVDCADGYRGHWDLDEDLNIVS